MYTTSACSVYIFKLFFALTDNKDLNCRHARAENTQTTNKTIKLLQEHAQNSTNANSTSAKDILLFI